ncbi:MAG: von Willebrand factor, type [Acidobacteria bacterium]|nr:von Willebrand factor, type [Acidobacteriota bacterium]
MFQPHQRLQPIPGATVRVVTGIGLGLAMILLGGTKALPAAAQAQIPQTTIRAEVPLVNIIFSALERDNRPVPGLTMDDFLVFEDRKPQKIEYFSQLTEGSEIPLTIALLIDTSGSVRTKLDDEKQTAAEFLRSILRKSKDEALIIQFDSEVRLVQDFTDDTERLVRALNSLEAGNSTSLYDAIYLAVEEKLKGEVGRKVIVAITDGDDTASKLKKEDAIEAAQRSDVLIYGIGVRSREFGANFGVLKRFAEETGGGFFSPQARMTEIQSAFKAIGEELKGQYSLAYTPENRANDGTFRAVEIRCKRKGIRVRARRGYYAPNSNSLKAAP